MAFRSSILVLLMALALCGTCHGATAGAAAYKVGGPVGWVIGVVDYNQWSASNEFHVGDTLLFSYNMYHNVMEVTEQGYESCDSSSPIAAYSSGSDTITLERPGRYYFICGVPGHCDAGQKVQVMVSSLPTLADSPVVSPSPAPTESSSPSTPSPSPSALSSPSTPSPAPSSLSTPSTPSPSPSVVSSPSSTPSPSPSVVSSPSSTSSPAPSPSSTPSPAPSPSTPYPQQKPSHSAAPTINAPKLALAVFFVSMLAFF